MQLKHLEYFVKTSQYKSFNDAAKSLFISQPSLSAAIANLEQELGYPLFVRSKQGITLSEEGAKILPDVIQILEIWNRCLVEHSNFNSSDMKGIVKIVAHSTICNTVLIDIISKATVQYPSIQISLKTSAFSVIFPSNMKQELNLAINFIKSNEVAEIQKKANDAACDVLSLCDVSNLAFINTTHPLANERSLSLKQLSEFNFVVSERYECNPYSELFSLLPASSLKIMPTREMMFDFISNNSKYAGIFLHSACRFVIT